MTQPQPTPAAGGRGPIGEPRNPTTVALLSLVTCGIYGLYWAYLTFEELKQHNGEGLGGGLGGLLPRDRRDPEDVPGRRQGVAGRADRRPLAPHPDRGLVPLHEQGAGRPERLLGVEGCGSAPGVVQQLTKGQSHG